MIKFLILLSLWTYTWSSTCTVNRTVTDTVSRDGVTVVDTTSTVVIKGNAFVCVNPSQLRSIMDTADRRNRSLDTALSVIALMEERNAINNELNKSLTGVDSIMLLRVDTLMKVVSLSDSINTKLDEIVEISEKRLDRCEESKMTIIEIFTTTVAIFLLGGFFGAAVF